MLESPIPQQYLGSRLSGHPKAYRDLKIFIGRKVEILNYCNMRSDMKYPPYKPVLSAFSHPAEYKVDGSLGTQDPLGGLVNMYEVDK